MGEDKENRYFKKTHEKQHKNDCNDLSYFSEKITEERYRIAEKVSHLFCTSGK